MDWAGLAFLAAVFSAGSHIIDRYVLKDIKEPAAFAAFTMIPALVVLAPIVIWLNPAWPSDPWLWALLILRGTLWGFLAWFWFKGDTHADVTLKMPLIRTRLIFVMLFAATLLGEVITPVKLLAVLLILLGAFIASSRKNTHWSHALTHPAVKYFVTGALIYGLTTAIDKVASPSFNPYGYTLVSFLIMFTIQFLMTSEKHKKLKLMWKEKPWAFLGKAIVLPAHFVLLTTAFQTGQALPISLIYELSTPMAFIGGYLILGERDNLKRRTIGAALVILASALIILG